MYEFFLFPNDAMYSFQVIFPLNMFFKPTLSEEEAAKEEQREN